MFNLQINSLSPSWPPPKSSLGLYLRSGARSRFASEKDNSQSASWTKERAKHSHKLFDSTLFEYSETSQGYFRDLYDASRRLNNSNDKHDRVRTRAEKLRVH